MGLFFDQQSASSSLTELLTEALMDEPPDTAGAAEVEARSRSQQMTPVVDAVKSALMHPAVADPATARTAAHKRATALTRSLGATPKFYWNRFLVALGLFLVIVAAAIGTDAANLKHSPTALFGLATTILGLVVGQLSGESSK